MVARDELVRHLDTLLEVALFEDSCPNGLQVEGRPEVRKVVTGVTSSLALIEEAVRRTADAIVVHHGIFWSGASPVLRGSMKKRVRALLEADLNLLAYHLPLDRHAEVGNNAPALRALGGVDLEPFAIHGGQPIGWRGRLATPVAAQGVPRARRGVLRRESDRVPRGPRDDPHGRRRLRRRRRRTRRRRSPRASTASSPGRSRSRTSTSRRRRA